MILKTLFLTFLLLLTSCARKHNKKTVYDVPRGASMFIEMPNNLTVFENLGPKVYESLWNHFQRVGFEMSSESRSDFSLRTKILKLENTERFVSPDVLPYVFKVNIKLECNLYSHDGKLMATKEFNFFKWVNRPTDPVINWTFLLVQYQELLEKSVPRIDHYFRHYIKQQKNNGI